MLPLDRFMNDQITLIVFTAQPVIGHTNGEAMVTSNETTRGRGNF